MSINTTPSISKRQLRQYSSRYTNPQLQSSLNKANTFTVLVNQHLAKTQQENHVLKTAKRSYSDKKIFRIYCRSASQKKTATNQMNQPKKQIEVPQATQLIQALDRNAEFIPYIRERFDQEMNQKLMLQQKMFQLKRKIYEQRKLKDKINLNNCKLINWRENSMKSTEIIKDQSRQKSMLIGVISTQCKQINIQLDLAKIMNRITYKRIEKQQKTVSQLKKHVHNTKLCLDRQTNRLNQFKHLQTIEYKKMTNLYTDINHLKQQKALLLNHVKTDVDIHL